MRAEKRPTKRSHRWRFVILAQELDTLSPWLQRGQRTYAAPLYAFRPALGRSTATAAVPSSSSSSSGSSLSVEAAQWLLEESPRVVAAAGPAAAGAPSLLTVLVNPHAGRALPFAVPNAFPPGCPAPATTAASAAAAPRQASAPGKAASAPGEAAFDGECAVALLFHHGQLLGSAGAAFSWAVDAASGELRGLLPALDTAAFVGTGSQANGACAPGKGSPMLSQAPQLTRRAITGQ